MCVCVCERERERERQREIKKSRNVIKAILYEPQTCSTIDRDFFILYEIYYLGHLDRTDGVPSPYPDVTVAEILVFLAITIPMGSCIRDKLTDCWANN